MHLVMIKLMMEKRDELISGINGGSSGCPLLFSREVFREKMHSRIKGGWLCPPPIIQPKKIDRENALVLVKLMVEKRDELILRIKGGGSGRLLLFSQKVLT